MSQRTIGGVFTESAIKPLGPYCLWGKDRGGRWNADPRRDVRDQRPCARMKDVDNNIIIFEPLMAYEASSIDRVFVAFFKEIINTLKPSIRQIPRLDELNLHSSAEPPSAVS